LAGDVDQSVEVMLAEHGQPPCDPVAHVHRAMGRKTDEVQAKDIEIGTEYAFREPPRRGVPMQRVRVLAKARSKWKVEWIDPNPGLEDWVASKNLVAPWKQRTALVRDEERREALERLAVDQGWDGPEGPVSDAIQAVLEAAGEFGLWVDNHGVLTGDPLAIERIAQRAGAPSTDERYGFTDRNGNRHEPFAFSLELARRFAATEPSTVLLTVDTHERDLEVEARAPFQSHMVRHLNKCRASHALVRQWAGHDQAVAQREAIIEDLKRAAWSAIWDLRQSDADPLRVADRLERAVRGHR
jgi:hypothetical protein